MAKRLATLSGRTVARVLRDGRRLRRTAGLGAISAAKSVVLARAAGHVVSRRMALGVDAMLNPALADHVEFARILPEKALAIRESAGSLGRDSAELTQHLLRTAAVEVAMATTAAVALAGCRSPEAALAAQSRTAMEMWLRSLSHSVAIGALLMRSCAAVMGPFHQATMRNSRRLS